jgi:hypothetical protein
MNTLLETRNLSKAYGKKQALRDISLQIQSGKLIGLIGPNGSGKSTLIKLINGLLVPSSGEILVEGKHPGVESKRCISYLPDRSYLADWQTPAQAMGMFRDMYLDFDMKKAKDMAQSLCIDLKKPLRTMSKGMQEKLQLILVMSRDAKLYILDEPLAGVDPAARDFIMRTILSNYRSDATLIISTHLIQDMENVLDEVIILKDGTLFTHSAVDALRDSHHMSLDQIFREEFKC